MIEVELFSQAYHRDRVRISRVYHRRKKFANAIINSALDEEENLAARDFCGRSSVMKRLFVARGEHGTSRASVA